MSTEATTAKPKRARKSKTETGGQTLYLRQRDAEGSDAKPRKVTVDSETGEAWVSGAKMYPKANWESVPAPEKKPRKKVAPRAEDLSEVPPEETSAESETSAEEPAPIVVPPEPELAESEPVDYGAFIVNKSQLDGDFGFAPLWMPDCMFDFQAHLTEWAIRGGRKALFEDCGLGKSLQELVWAQNVLMYTNKPTLIITPLAVTQQFLTEGEKFGVDVKRIRDGQVSRGVVNVTNYEQLHKLNPHDFGGVACDESSILKNCDGKTRKVVTEFLRTMRYRLLCTATAAPNDLPELGTSSEALGYLGHMDMLSRFFVNDQRNSVDTAGKWRGHAAPRAYVGPRWRFRGHAEEPFWRWVCSWARSIRKPSDFGFADGGFTLPPLVQNEHTVSAAKPREGMLFSLPARGLREEREERRRTIRERCERVATLLDTTESAVAWCHLNDEGDLLEELIPGAVQVSGADSDEEKEEKLLAFGRGEARVLVTKPIIAAWGLNWQHCAHMTSFASHSFEQSYQSVRRCWRFGQKRPVVVDYVLSDGEGAVLENLKRKADQADILFSQLVRYMQDALHIKRGRTFDRAATIPSWLRKQ